MPKGVYKHTKENTNSDAIRALQAQYVTELQSYKALAAAHRQQRRYNIQEITRALSGVLEYVNQCQETGEPATISGMILSSGTNKDFYYKARAGEYDYITFEYIDLNNITPDQCQDINGITYYNSLEGQIMLSPASDVLEKCLLIIENDLQIRSLTDKSMARTTGAIFNLKAVFNYNDKPEIEAKTVNNTLIVNASPDQTAKAMQLLLDNK